jgi:hypothetical protein
MAGSRSDTLDDLKSAGLGSPESKPARDSDDDDDLFRSARIEPEPEKFPASSTVEAVLAEAPADSVIALDDDDEDEDANPFQVMQVVSLPTDTVWRD